MDDDKNIIEKAIEAVKDIAHVASEAAKHAMEPEPMKPGDKVVMLVPESGGLLGEAPLPQFIVIPRKKRQTKKASKKSAKKTAKNATKKTAKKSDKKTVKKKKAKTRSGKKKKKAKRG
jgi:hypothetical protein